MFAAVQESIDVPHQLGLDLPELQLLVHRPGLLHQQAWAPAEQ